MLAGQAAARALSHAGVPWVAGVSGESFLPLLDGLRHEGIPFINTIHESGAAFIASAYGRTTGRPGVVAVTRGPGASNALVAIHDAAQSEAPLVAIVGQVESRIRGRRALQEMEFKQVFQTVAKETFEVGSPEQVVPAVLAALRKAVVGRPGPVVVSVPADHFYGEVGEPIPSVALDRIWSAGILPDAMLREIIAAAQSAHRGVLLTGAAFASCQNQEVLGALAERLGFAVLGGHAFPDALPADHSMWIGCSTIRGPLVAKRALREADVVISLGHWLGDRVSQGYLSIGASIYMIRADSDSGWDEYLDAKLVTADPVDACRQLLAASAPADDRRSDRAAWTEGLRKQRQREAEDVLDENRVIATGVPFAEILGALDRALPDPVTLVSDVGTFNDWVTRYLPFPSGRRYLGSLSGSMGFGLPAGLGVKLARPEESVVVLAGDGGFMMTAMELASAIKHRIPVKVVVFRNRIWGSIALHQDQEFPGQRFAIELPETSAAAICRALGGRGVHVTDADSLEPTLREAFAGDDLTLVEIDTDSVRPSPSYFDKPDAALIGATA